MTIILLLSGLSMLSAFPMAASASIPHEPIVIDGNEDFNPDNGVAGGSGTKEDPYIIEGWDIDSTSASGIMIINTDAFFIIRNVSVHSESATYAGIWIEWFTENGRIENTTISNNSIGIFVGAMCSNITVIDNSLYGNRKGIFAELNDMNIVISRNVATQNAIGIMNNDSPNTLIMDNSISSNQKGILITGIRNITVTENEISSNGVGIDIDLWSFNYPAEDIRIFHNNIIDNDIQAMDSNGDYTIWDNGYPSGGNYWSDYFGSDIMSGPGQNISGADGIGDTPYTILSEGADRYPLMEPFSNEEEPPVVIMTGNMTVIRQGPGGPKRNVIAMEFSPESDGFWWGEIHNHKLSHALVIISEITPNGYRILLDERIGFGGEQSSTKECSEVFVHGGSHYSMTVVPFGKKGAYFEVEGWFKSISTDSTLLSVNRQLDDTGQYWKFVITGIQGTELSTERVFLTLIGNSGQTLLFEVPIVEFSKSMGFQESGSATSMTCQVSIPAIPYC